MPRLFPTQAPGSQPPLPQAQESRSLILLPQDTAPRAPSSCLFGRLWCPSRRPGTGLQAGHIDRAGVEAGFETPAQRARSDAAA